MTTGSDGLRRPARGDRLAVLVGELAGGPVRPVNLEPVDSSQLTAAAWPGILAATGDAAAGSTAVVVTHGTDTLAWTAAMLAAAGPWPVPVVLTAANVPEGDPGSDAVTNLTGALAAARALPAGVVVAFAGVPDGEVELFAGGFVTKRRGDGRAFVARGARLGHVDGDEVRVETDAPVLTDRATRGRFDQRVRTLVCTPFTDAETVSAAGAGVDAVALELYACGTASDAVAVGCRRLTDAGVTVWACPPSPIDAAHYPSTGALTGAGVTVRLDLSIELAAVLLADRVRS